MPYENRTPQTHCRKGHPMEGNNVIVRKDGYRRCRECVRMVKRRWARRDYVTKREARLADGPDDAALLARLASRNRGGSLTSGGDEPPTTMDTKDTDDAG